MCDFHDLLERYSNTIPSNNLLFRISKQCGYSQLVVIPRDEPATVKDLCERVQREMGEYTKDKIIFYTKHTEQIAIDFSKDYTYLHLFCDDPLAKFAVDCLPLAYSIDDCRYAVYQLHLDMSGLSCNQPHHHQPHSISYATTDTALNNQYEPTREELLSLIYDPVAEIPMEVEVETNTNSVAEDRYYNHSQLDYII